jgi:hypothetical protein
MSKIQRRSRGQTVTYGDPREKATWEWIYTPTELCETTWRQIESECRKGARIRVIQWPEGFDIFRNGEYIVNLELREVRVIREEEPL